MNQNNLDINYKAFRPSRVEYEKIGDTVYAIVAAEKDSATDTPLDVVRRLIDRNTNSFIKERTCCLQTDGGKK